MAKGKKIQKETRRKLPVPPVNPPATSATDVLRLEEELKNITDRIQKALEEFEELEIQISQAQEELSKRNLLLETIEDARRAGEEEIKAQEAEIRQHCIDDREAELKEMEQKAQKRAERIIQQAESKADSIAERARSKAEAIALDAENASRKSQAEADAKGWTIIAEARANADAVYSKQKADLTALEHRLQTESERIRQKQCELELHESDLRLELQSLHAEKADLEERWEKCSPAALARLENENAYLRKYLEQEQRNSAELQDRVITLERLEALIGDRGPEWLSQELSNKDETIRVLRDQLSRSLPQDEVDSLRHEASQSAWLRTEIESLREQLNEKQNRLARMETSHMELDSIMRSARAARALNDGLKRELDNLKENLEERSREAFPALCQIDRDQPARESTRKPKTDIDLKHLVEYIANYAASRQPYLYYSPATVRAFIAGLAASKLLILEGLSGTGKTSLPRVFAEAIEGRCYTIPVQSSWRDRHEFLGYYNEFSKRYTESEFTKVLYEVGLPLRQDDTCLIVLDEMNLARVEYYFADFLSVIEDPNKEKWLVPLMSHRPETAGDSGPDGLVDGYKLRVPPNVWFVGTANKDESTFEITDKVYDRAQVLDFTQRQEPFEPAQHRSVEMSYSRLQQLLDAASKSGDQLTNDDWDRICLLDSDLHKMDLAFGNRIKDQMEVFIPVYVAAGGSKNEAIDIQLARKVLRKLRGRHDPQFIDDLERLRNTLSDLFAGYPMPFCQEAIMRHEKSLGVK